MFGIEHFRNVKAIFLFRKESDLNQQLYCTFSFVFFDIKIELVLDVLYSRIIVKNYFINAMLYQYTRPRVHKAIQV